ncbi:hypothetical protein [Psychrobacillus sp. FSL K6-4046]|uniref:hypothetical protein n=1 Tax=Psychrobacillus sp. FSL K6-4046 TaxID=2921550 RepID=UPI0026257662|nr:hypothetical protein [uncultured Psychrobacillus sp.]
MRKEIFMEQFKQVLMTNQVASTSISLQSTFEEMKKEIELNSVWSIEERNLFLHHLNVAHRQIKQEIAGIKQE